MDTARVHLFIAHMPVFGIFLGILVLIYGLIKNNSEIKIVSLSIFMIAVIGGFIAFQTGHSAEETVEQFAGISESSIEQHEESAELTVLFIYVIGFLSCIALYLEIRSNKFSRFILYLTLALSLITFFLVTRTASLGGKIRHTEINGGSSESID